MKQQLTSRVLQSYLITLGQLLGNNSMNNKQQSLHHILYHNVHACVVSMLKLPLDGRHNWHVTISQHDTGSTCLFLFIYFFKNIFILYITICTKTVFHVVQIIQNKIKCNSDKTTSKENVLQYS